MRLKGDTLDEIIEEATQCQKNDAYGMLCPINLLRNGKDFNRIGRPVHGSEWTKSNLENWKKTALQNEDLVRLMKKNKD